MGKIIAVANQKGGVGKTTTAVNLSACLANNEKKVLMVDIDPQGNGSSGLGVVKRTKMKNTYSLIIEGEDISKCITKTNMNNLKLIPSPPYLRFGSRCWGHQISLPRTRHPILAHRPPSCRQRQASRHNRDPQQRR